MARIVVGPQEGAQSEAFTSKASVIIYGGAAGCLDGETEYLSRNGWKKVSEYQGEEILSFDTTTESVQFEEPSEYIKKPANTFYHFKSKGVDQMLSSEHMFLHKSKEGVYMNLMVDGIIHNIYGDFEPTFVSTFKDVDGVTSNINSLSDNEVRQLKGCVSGKSFIIKKGKCVRSKKKQYLFGSKHKTGSIGKYEGGYKYCFTTSTGAFVVRRNGHVFITGNSGKSHLLLMHPLQHIKDPNFHGIFFRRVTTQLVGAGGLWPESKKMYAPWKPKVVTKPQLKQTFPSGATLTFSHMQLEDDCEQHQGLQYSAVFWDELTHFSLRQFTYLLSRLRSEAKVDSYCMASCNPDSESWVLEWIESWLLPSGLPDPEKRGMVRYYLMIDDKPKFADTAEELIERYPHATQIENPLTGEIVHIAPKSFCFIGGTIFDNPKLISSNPQYLAELNALPRVERERLRDGNWRSKPSGSKFLQAEWLHDAEEVPEGSTCVRAWDKGYSEPTEKNRYPDYSAGIKMYKCPLGMYYIVGDFSPDNFDKDDPSVFGRFRKRFGERNLLMVNQAHYDGEDCTVVIPEESGAGKGEYEQMCKMFIEEGFKVKGAKVGNVKGGKLKRFSSFSSAAQNGLVHIVKNSFPNLETLNTYIRELETFDGSPSTATIKDDWVDATADCFLALQKTKVYKPVAIPTFNNSQTMYSRMKHSLN